MNGPGSRRILVVAGGVFGIALLVIMFAPGESDSPSEPTLDANALVVETIGAVPLERYSVNRRFVGRVEAKRESNVGFELPGVIDSVVVDDGSFIEKGDALARLNTELLEARKQELLAAKNSAKAQLDLATTTRTRVLEASALDAVSSQVLDEAESSFANSKAAYAAAQSAINSIEVQIRRSEIIAPFAAVVSRRYLDEGRVVSPGEPVLRLLEQTSPQVRLAVANSAADQLVVGNEYLVNINGREVSGVLTAVLPERQNLTRAVETLFQLDAAAADFRPGDLAEVLLTEEIKQRGFRLPVTSLTESARGIWAVYVAVATDEGFQLDRRQVEILHQEGDSVIVRGTLSAGDEVVSSGLHRLMPGQQVRPRAMQTGGRLPGGSL